MPTGRYLPLAEIQDILKDNRPAKKIALDRRLDASTINKLHKKHGIVWKMDRKHKVNDHYFRAIDTQEKAYWLGFLYADGNVYHSKNRTPRKILSFSQSETDIKSVADFKVALSAEQPLTLGINKRPNQQNCYQVVINSPQLCESLEKLGVYPRKSLTLQFPTSDQVPDFRKRHPHSPANAWSLTFSSKQSIKDFYHYLYDDSLSHMTRKKKRFDDYFQHANLSIR